ncbi:hypothetical protein PENTCL1PPCAC_30751 [Pristionchus entomophagus]|uniref:PDZ domain-containing protein n=1 Tax=Pristionchus entomophagus TaxID=358040 RepID=A0AAV5UQJ1_9BILA|nr:hypothetical protein PENTCL1PPCAC_30751 [Pristionchus entomophagus]
MGRKSKMADSFYDAAARLEEMGSSSLGPSHSHSVPDNLLALSTPPPLSAAHSKSDSSSASALLPAADPAHTVVVLHDRQKNRLGIEVSGVQDETSIGRLAALQITSIDPDGRVGRDGGLRIGDNIVELNGRPVAKMSLIRARTYLFELAIENSPTLTVARPLESFHTPSSSSSSSCLTREGTAQGSMKKPIQSALQQANTVEIRGEQMRVEIQKRNGFGFTVTGRETGTGRHLFYVGTVRAPPAYGVLHGGDRILEVNGESLEDLRQSEVVDRLKRVNEGETVRLLLSRVGGVSGDKEREREEERAEREDREERDKVDAGWEELVFSIPLNNSGSAGLGVSLKARVTVKNDRSRHDCGIFVKKLLHGGAAHRDGRLRVDDRLVAIEEEGLRTKTNAEASGAITTTLKSIGDAASAVTLRVWRPHSSREEEGEKRGGGEALDESINGGGGTPASTPTHVKIRQCEYAIDDRRATISSECSGTDLDESTISPVDAFDREAPTRKSISEKRGMGASSDAALTTTFQKIKHGRQTSAPPTSASFHGVSAVAKRTAERIRSQSVHPRVAPEERREGDEEEGEEAEEREEREEREEETRRRSNTLGNSIPTENGGGGGERTGRSNGINSRSHTFKQAVDDTNLPWMYRSSTDSPLMMRKPNEHKEKDKERRKSMGSGLRSLFKLGKSREADLDKNEEYLRRREEENRRRMEEDLRLHNSRTTPTSMRRATLYSEYSPVQYPPPYRDDPPSPLRSPLIVANSKFYSSHTRDPRPLTHTSLIDTRAIGTAGIPSLHPLSTTSSNNGPTSSSSSIITPRPLLQPRPLTAHPSYRMDTVERAWEEAPVSNQSTTRHSMPGSRIRLEEEGRRGHLEGGVPSMGGEKIQRDRDNQPTLAFPTTRFPLYMGGGGGGGGGGTSSTGTAPRLQKERLSLRARKKQREERERAPPPPSSFPPPPPPDVEIPLIRMRREPMVYNGGSLPARNLVHPVTRPSMLSRDLYASPSPPLVSRL